MTLFASRSKIGLARNAEAALTDSATLEVMLDADFLAAAEAAERAPSDIVADLMREFVERERISYTDFLRRKVEEGRRCVARGEVDDADSVEAEFAALGHEIVTGSHRRS